MLLSIPYTREKRGRAADDRNLHCGALRPPHWVWSVIYCTRTNEMCAHRPNQPLGPRIVVWRQRITIKVSWTLSLPQDWGGEHDPKVSRHRSAQETFYHLCAESRRRRGRVSHEVPWPQKLHWTSRPWRCGRIGSAQVQDHLRLLEQDGQTRCSQYGESAMGLPGHRRVWHPNALQTECCC